MTSGFLILRLTSVILLLPKLEKERRRCVQIEHAFIMPLIFIAYGRYNRETYHFLNAPSKLLSNKKGVSQRVATDWLRTKINFALTRALIICASRFVVLVVCDTDLFSMPQIFFK